MTKSLLAMEDVYINGCRSTAKNIDNNQPYLQKEN